MTTSILNGEQEVHAVLPLPTSDEFARQEFIKSLKYHLSTRIAPGIRDRFEKQREPLFREREGRAPADRHEVRELMADDRYFRTWSALERTSQEMMWKSVQVSIARQLPELIHAAESARGTRGSLRLDPALTPPAYSTAVDIHLMPGGYHTEVRENDIAAGALYDRGVYLYANGRMGPRNADPGESAAAYIKKHFPDFRPRRILDMGCTTGNSTLAWADAFPDAEVHGIDVGAPVLRYAHARANSLGYNAHWSQQNAERTDFPDAHFDLVVSHIFLHETSRKALPRIIAECQRLLTPGGVMIHTETPPYEGMSAYDAFMFDWDTRNNNEPFWTASHELVPAVAAEKAGFPRDSAFEARAASHYCTTQSKPKRVFKGGEVAGGWSWYVWGARKAAANDRKNG